MPVDLASLHEAVPDLRELPFGGNHGTNDFKNLGYGGPCPPPGAPHHYHFRLYALDAMVALEPGASKEEVTAAMEGHVLDQAELVGTYQRR
jgi:Raf kinase inhibitor-like YbhB/YbcL family protein